jgi:hypothetical protein
VRLDLGDEEGVPGAGDAEAGDVDPREVVEREDDAARLRLARGDAAGAADLYQRLVDATPENNPARQIWQLRLAEAQAARTAKQGS